jgi:hypothetical protein
MVSKETQPVMLYRRKSIVLNVLETEEMFYKLGFLIFIFIRFCRQYSTVTDE